MHVVWNHVLDIDEIIQSHDWKSVHSFLIFYPDAISTDITMIRAKFVIK